MLLFGTTPESSTLSFILAHRLSTVVDVDEIIVLENGSIVERGDHRTLLNTEGSRYSVMWDLQAREHAKEHRRRVVDV